MAPAIFRFSRPPKEKSDHSTFPLIRDLGNPIAFWGDHCHIYKSYKSKEQSEVKGSENTGHFPVGPDSSLCFGHQLAVRTGREQEGRQRGDLGAGRVPWAHPRPHRLHTHSVHVKTVGGYLFTQCGGEAEHCT